MAKFKRGKSGNPAERPKGSLNKYSTIKLAFLEAFEEIGGTKTLTKWAETNKKDFYSMVARLLPKNIEVESNDQAAVRMTFFPPQPKSVAEWQKMVKEMNDGKVQGR